jgi:hypothetical protein
MITVYFDDVDFSKKSFRGTRADISVVGQREILSIRDYADNAIAQFDVNAVVGWCNDDYEYTDEEGDTE